MRIWLRVPLGLLSLGLYLFFGARAISVPNQALAMGSGLIALGFVFSASYLWGRWWINALSVGSASLLLTLGRGSHSIMLILVTMILAAVIGWWSHVRFRGPPSPAQALLGVAVLILVSFCLAALVPVPSFRTAGYTLSSLAVAYLATPPWEGLIVLVILSQSGQLRRFFRENYRLSPKALSGAALGLAVGLAMLVAVALLVLVETQGLKVHVQSNNPFVFVPGLSHGHPLIRGLIVAGMIVLAPMAEEALFRGILFLALSHRWGYWVGSLASAAIFGLAHRDLTLFIPLTLAGFILNELYRRTRSLIPSTVAHATLNAVSVLSALGVGTVFLR